MEYINDKESASHFTGERFIPGIKDYQLHIEHYQRYLSAVPMVENKVVVDAACGDGYGSNLLAQSAKSVVGVDIDYTAIQCANNKYRRDNLKYVQGSIEKLPIDDKSVDILISFETIEHISEDLQWNFIVEARRVLKEDGILIISTPNKEIYSDLYNYHNEFHIKEFYKNEFENFLKSEFNNIRIYHQFFETVGVIDSYEAEVKKAIYLRDTEKYNLEGKYFIGIASNVSLPEISMTSLHLNSMHEYEMKNLRIIELQGEVEERNNHIQKLNSEIEMNRSFITQLQMEQEDRNNHIKVLDSEIEGKDNHFKMLNQQIQDIQTELTNVLNEFQTEINEKDLIIDQLKKLINDKNFIINEKDAEFNNLNKLINDKDFIINQKDAEFNNLNRLINDRDYIINQKEIIINDLRRRSIKIPKRLYRLWLRIITLPRNIYETLFPLSTRRRLFVSRCKNRMLHPIQNARLKKMYQVDKIPDKVTFEQLRFPGFEKPLVSIIIPVYNQMNYTYNCLKSILNETNNIPYEIIIADDVSTDETKNISNFIHGITVIHNSENLGFLRNCNNAATKAKGDFLFFLNNDTQVLANWLQPLIDLMNIDETIGMVGSKLIFSDGTLQEAGGILWNDGSAWNYGRSGNPTSSEFNYVKEVDYISGAAIMIRSSLWKQISGFDERYAPAYCEDSDLAFEVRKHGYKVMYQPLSEVIHFEGISNGNNVNSGIKKYQIENNVKFREKWEDELKNHYPNAENVFRARERSQNKKIIVVIDHYVPTFDKDAGSKTTFQYLKMFLNKGFAIKFIGDNFYKSEPYTTVLQQMGIEVLYGPWYANHVFDWLKQNKEQIHVVYLNRPHITAKYVDFLKTETNIKLIYYGHDFHSLRLKREYELTGDTGKLKESQEWMKKEIDIMRKVDVSYYPSYIEINEINQIDSKIAVKAITAYVYDKFKEQINVDMVSREGILFVGGFGHTPNIDAVLWFINSIYPLIRKELNINFYIVGSNPPREIVELNQEGVIVKGFVTEEELEVLYSSCRIAVVPLRFGAGVKGKVVEAIYNGIPIITTSCGAEGFVNAANVFAIADDEEEFARIVVELYSDTKRLLEYSDNEQRYIQEYFGINEVWKVIEEDFR